MTYQEKNAEQLLKEVLFRQIMYHVGAKKRQPGLLLYKYMEMALLFTIMENPHMQADKVERERDNSLICTRLFRRAKRNGKNNINGLKMPQLKNTQVMYEIMREEFRSRQVNNEGQAGFQMTKYETAKDMLSDFKRVCTELALFWGIKNGSLLAHEMKKHLSHATSAKQLFTLVRTITGNDKFGGNKKRDPEPVEKRDFVTENKVSNTRDALAMQDTSDSEVDEEERLCDGKTDQQGLNTDKSYTSDDDSVPDVVEKRRRSPRNKKSLKDEGEPPFEVDNTSNEEESYEVDMTGEELSDDDISVETVEEGSDREEELEFTSISGAMREVAEKVAKQLLGGGNQCIDHATEEGRSLRRCLGLKTYRDGLDAPEGEKPEIIMKTLKADGFNKKDWPCIFHIRNAYSEDVRQAVMERTDCLAFVVDQKKSENYLRACVVRDDSVLKTGDYALETRWAEHMEDCLIRLNERVVSDLTEETLALMEKIKKHPKRKRGKEKSLETTPAFLPLPHQNALITKAGTKATFSWHTDGDFMMTSPENDPTPVGDDYLPTNEQLIVPTSVFCREKILSKEQLTRVKWQQKKSKQAKDVLAMIETGNRDFYVQCCGVNRKGIVHGSEYDGSNIFRIIFTGRGIVTETMEEAYDRCRALDNTTLEELNEKHLYDEYHYMQVVSGAIKMTEQEAMAGSENRSSMKALAKERIKARRAEEKANQKTALPRETFAKETYHGYQRHFKSSDESENTEAETEDGVQFLTWPNRMISMNERKKWKAMSKYSVVREAFRKKILLSVVSETTDDPKDGTNFLHSPVHGRPSLPGTTHERHQGPFKSNSHTKTTLDDTKCARGFCATRGYKNQKDSFTKALNVARAIYDLYHTKGPTGEAEIKIKPPTKKETKKVEAMYKQFVEEGILLNGYGGSTMKAGTFAMSADTACPTDSVLVCSSRQDSKNKNNMALQEWHDESRVLAVYMCLDTMEMVATKAKSTKAHAKDKIIFLTYAYSTKVVQEKDKLVVEVDSIDMMETYRYESYKQFHAKPLFEWEDIQQIYETERQMKLSENPTRQKKVSQKGRRQKKPSQNGKEKVPCSDKYYRALINVTDDRTIRIPVNDILREYKLSSEEHIREFHLGKFEGQRPSSWEVPIVAISGEEHHEASCGLELIDEEDEDEEAKKLLQELDKSRSGNQRYKVTIDQGLAMVAFNTAAGARRHDVSTCTSTDHKGQTVGIPLMNKDDDYLTNMHRIKAMPMSITAMDVNVTLFSHDCETVIEASNAPFEKVSDYTCTYCVPDITKPEVQEVMKELIFMAATNRITGSAPRLEHYKEVTESKTALPTRGDLPEFETHIHSIRCATMNPFASKQHNQSIPNCLTNSKDRCLMFMNEFANSENGVDAIVSLMTETTKVTRESLHERIYQSLADCANGRFTLGDSDRLKWLASKIISDIEDVIPGFFGKITEKSVHFGPGSRSGLKVVGRSLDDESKEAARKELELEDGRAIGKGQESTQNKKRKSCHDNPVGDDTKIPEDEVLLRCIHKAFKQRYLELDNEKLLAFGLQKGKVGTKDVLFNIANGREYDCRDTEQELCKIWKVITNSHPSRTISRHPYCTNGYCHPVICQEAKWSKTHAAVFKKIWNAFVLWRKDSEYSNLLRSYPRFVLFEGEELKGFD